jgi:hypothetical protein
MRRIAALILCAICVAATTGQSLEDWIEQTDHPDDLHEWIEELRREPLDLNAATLEQIALLPLFDQQSAQKIITQREQIGSFRSLQDVLAGTSLTGGQRQVVRELTTMMGPLGSAPPRARGYLTVEQRGASNGKTSLAKSTARLQAVLHHERQSGYVFVRRQADDADVIHQTAVGLEIRPQGIGGRVLLGDFQYEAGTGLVFASAFGMANWLSAPNGVRPDETRGLVLRPSSDRQMLLHGGAVSLASDWAEAVVVGSTTGLDAALNNGAVERVTEGEAASSELAAARRDQLRETLAGFSVVVKQKNWRVGSTGYYSHFSPMLAASDANALDLSGDHLKMGSLFAQTRVADLTAVGEVATSNPGGQAWQAAAAWNREPISMSVWHVRADPDFHSPRSQVWGGYGAQANNLDASGIRLRATAQHHVWWLSASAENTPFRTSRAPLGLNSSDVEMRWTIRLTGAMDGEILAGRNRRGEASVDAPARDVRVDRARCEVRFHDQEDYKIRFELRAAHGDDLRQTGTLLFVQAKTQVSKFDVFGRLTYFHLDGSELNTAVYEMTPAGSYPLVALAGRGTRATVLIRRRWSSLMAAAKIAVTERAGVDADQRKMDAAITLSYQP